MTWRVNHLAEQNEAYEENEKRYQTTISVLREDAERRDAVALADRDDTVANERARSELIGDIYESEATSNCGDIVHRTIDSLLKSEASTEGD